MGLNRGERPLGALPICVISSPAGVGSAFAGGTSPQDGSGRSYVEIESRSPCLRDGAQAVGVASLSGMPIAI